MTASDLGSVDTEWTAWYWLVSIVDLYGVRTNLLRYELAHEAVGRRLHRG